CAAIAANLRGAWHGIAPSLPVPGGGIELRDVPDAVEFYGRDAMLLVGGSLQLEPGRVLERSRAFAAAVADAFREFGGRVAPAARSSSSSCRAAPGSEDACARWTTRRSSSIARSRCPARAWTWASGYSICGWDGSSASARSSESIPGSGG